MIDPAPDNVGAELVAELTDFMFSLRLAGLPVTIDGSMNLLRAVAALDSFDHVQLFWAGRATLCCEPGDFDIYDDTFNWFFRRPVPPQIRRLAALQSAPDDVAELTDPVRQLPPVRRSHRDLPELTGADRAQLGTLLRQLEAVPAARRPARHSPGPGFRFDPAGSLRSALRGGELALRHRAGGVLPRRLVLLIDVSDSMAPHAVELLRFAHAVRHKLGSSCEVFTLGDTLNRLSATLAERDRQLAVAAAVETLPPRSGGTTKIGHALRAFLDQHGQRGMARGAVVILISDGCETGDNALLASQTRRLSRLSRSLIWVVPAAGDDGALLGGAIDAVEPFCDHLLAADSLAVLGELLDIAHDA